MTGDSFAEKVSEQKALLETILGPSAPAESRGPALDLGSGPGYQAIALAELGFSPVIAMDTSAELLDELKLHRGSHPIQIVQADLASLDGLDAGRGASLAVCMGDTLSHLVSKESVKQLFAAVFRKLASGGRFAITYRDLSAALTGLDRFISVRSDHRKVMTCFLEYESDDFVVVHDLLHVQEDQGWRLEKSAYRKLRLSPAGIAAALAETGFIVCTQGTVERLILIVAEKP